MYLTDAQLEARLAEFDFYSEDALRPFDAATQIGPCSIDLRLSRVIWTYHASWRNRARPLFLDRSRLQELQPRRQWHRKELAIGESFTIRPGQVVLGRTCEAFAMPENCAGALEGRSSYARLGLEVHLAGGFINPGWSGHMPLVLANHSPAPLRIPVHAPLCQLMVLPLAQAPTRSYRDRGSIYQNDDGGPSYWWRDRLFKKLMGELGPQLGDQVLNQLDELLGGDLNDNMLDRFEKYLFARRRQTHANAHELLESFAVSEDRNKIKRTLLRVLTTGAGAGALTSLVFGLIQGLDPLTAGLLLGFTAIAVGVEGWLQTHPSDYWLGRSELASLRRRADGTQ